MTGSRGNAEKESGEVRAAREKLQRAHRRQGAHETTAGARIGWDFAILLIKIIQLIKISAGIFRKVRLLHHTATQNAF